MRGERALAALLLAPLVSPSARFVIREVGRRRVTADYRVRAGGPRFAFRHREHDLATLAEVFGRRDYAIPAEVRATLAPRDVPLRVLDLGANSGLFVVFLLAELGDRFSVDSFEPDPRSFVTLQRTQALNSALVEWRLHRSAAGLTEDKMTFLADGSPSARIVAPQTPGTVTVDVVDVFPHLRNVDLVKIDIEGGEWGILSDPRFRELPNLRAIVLEFHPRNDDAMAPSAREEAVDLVRNAGMRVAQVQEFANGHGLLWALR